MPIPVMMQYMYHHHVSRPVTLSVATAIDDNEQWDTSDKGMQEGVILNEVYACLRSCSGDHALSEAHFTPATIRPQAAGSTTAERRTPALLVLTPVRRERIDHYGNNGEGWDEEAWKADYARPWQSAVADKLGDLARHCDVAIGEKGHVEIQAILPHQA